MTDGVTVGEDGVTVGEDAGELVAIPERKKRVEYSKAVKLKARMLFEVDAMTHKQISEEVGMTTTARTIAKWSADQGWKKGCLTVLAEETAIASKMELARRLGLGQKEQFLKAKELMEAHKTGEGVEITPDGKIVSTIIEVPDYKIQNEGLKRAMELTGTKIERTEHEHTHSGEMVHKYYLPEKIILNPDKEVKIAEGSSS